MISAAVEQCDLPAEVARIDCDAYPCIALLERDSALAEGEDPDDVYTRLETLLSGCESLQTKLGWEMGDPKREHGVQVMSGKTIECGDGRHVAMGVRLFPPTSDFLAVRRPGEAGLVEMMEGWPEDFARFGNVSSTWSCDSLVSE